MEQSDRPPTWFEDVGVVPVTDGPESVRKGAAALAHANRLHGVPARLHASTAGSGAHGARTAAALRDHFGAVWRTLRRMGVESSTLEDCAQHVFLTFMARAAEVSAERERAFLVGAAIRVAANARRRTARSAEGFGDFEPDDRDGLTPEELVDWKQRREALDRALDALSLEQRTVFVLFELEGFALREIAEMLDVPLGTASSRLNRARAGFEAWVEAHQRENSR